MLNTLASIVAPLPDYEDELMEAAFSGNVGQARKAIDNGANVNCKNKISRNAPLHVASYHGNEGIVLLLLNERAKCNLAGRDDNTPLHFASRRGNENIIKILLSSGADPNRRNNVGDRPIHHAILGGHAPAVSQLLAAGASVDVKGNFGCTPLHCSALKDDIDVARVLLEANADHLVRNTKGQTPKELAPSVQMKRLLEEASAKRCEWLFSSVESNENVSSDNGRINRILGNSNDNIVHESTDRPERKIVVDKIVHFPFARFRGAAREDTSTSDKTTEEGHDENQASLTNVYGANDVDDDDVDDSFLDDDVGDDSVLDRKYSSSSSSSSSSAPTAAASSNVTKTYEMKDYCSSLLVDAENYPTSRNPGRLKLSLEARSKLAKKVERSIATIAATALEERRVMRSKMIEESARPDNDAIVPSVDSIVDAIEELARSEEQSGKESLALSSKKAAAGTSSVDETAWRPDEKTALVISDPSIMSAACFDVTRNSTELEMPFGGVTNNERYRQMALGQTVAIIDVDETNNIVRIEMTTGERTWVPRQVLLRRRRVNADRSDRVSPPRQPILKFPGVKWATVDDDPVLVARACLEVTLRSSEFEMPWGETEMGKLRQEAVGRKVRVLRTNSDNAIAEVQFDDGRVTWMPASALRVCS